jgi:Dyp-type peroxidase family
MGTLQEGIYHDCSGCTPSSLATVFLKAAGAVSAAQVADALLQLWRMYQRLKEGEVRDLPGSRLWDPGQRRDELHVLLGYGRSAFERDGAALPLPGELDVFGFPRHQVLAGAPVMGNAGLGYAGDLTDNLADADIAVQFTAERQITVYRAVVETWKLLDDLGAALRMAGFYSGHQRDDHRSWIDFHDGVNNLRKEERERVITIKPEILPRWPAGGTYMAFLRIAIDLPAWRNLDRRAQQRIVGRDKLTGAPLVAGEDGNPTVPPGFVTENGADVLDPENQRFREQRFPDPLPSSHINRATNHRRQYPELPTSARIFRQSYEFLERLEAPPYFRAGLNFVSFQDTPERLHTILTKEGWLGRSNFGGEPGMAPAGQWLLSARAAGMFLVPPVDPAEAFPGSSILGLAADQKALSREATTGPPG